MIMGLVAVVSIGVVAQTGGSVSSLIQSIANAITDAGSQAAQAAYATFGDSFNGFAYTINDDGSVTFGNGAYPRSNNNTASITGSPTHVTLFLTHGSTRAPDYVAVDSARAGFNGYFTGVTDSSGNPIYELTASPFKPDNFLTQGDNFSFFMSNQLTNQPTTSTVGGYLFSY